MADLQASARRATLCYEELRENLTELDLKSSAYRDSLSAIAIEDDTLQGLARADIVRLRLRRRMLIQACQSKTWPYVEPFSPESPALLKKLGSNLLTRANELNRSVDAKEKAKLHAELAELTAREWLIKNMEEVKKELLRLLNLEMIETCLSEANTMTVTKMSTSFANEFITNRLRDQFATELKNLGIRHVNVELAGSGGEYGSQKYRIRLIAAPTVRLGDVLSEGEHRCIALAGFFAELATANNRSALVFDDPVSSLDHRWRRFVAERLAKESKSRQVVVFTHDVVFLLLLQEFAARHGVELKTTHLRRETNKPGVVYDGLPWIAMPVKKRIGYLKNDLQQAKAKYDRGGEAEYRMHAASIYGMLRETWERAIEEVLLNSVVLRFGRAVETKRLRVLTDISEDDYNQIDAAMSKCSTYLRGHDEAAAINDAIPAPEELGSDLKEIEDWVASMRKRGRN